MTVISSQRYIDWAIVEEKIEELKDSNVNSITVPVINAYIQDLEGNDLYIMIDKHHTLQAARELGLTVEFEEVEDTASWYEDIENKNGEAICKTWYMDSNWYYVSHADEDMVDVDVW